MNEEKTSDLDPSQEEEVSKTRRKKEMLAVQELGLQLTEVSPALLDKCNLPESLQHAINEYKRIPKKHGAKKRQLQFIGKLMRDVDAESIRAVLVEDSQHAELEKRRFHRLEEIREQLLSGDQSFLNEIISQCPDLDIQHVRQLIRQAAREAQHNKPPAASRKLFTYLRGLPEL